MPKLGVNVDHVATVREARKVKEPDPVYAASLCEKAGCDSIVCHLREDRRHINDTDLRKLKKTVTTRLNLEMSAQQSIVAIACRVRPDQATLVPEKREELTTEGGLNVCENERAIKRAVAAMTERGIEVSLFIDPDIPQIDASRRVGARIIELHTGMYANAATARARERSARQLERATQYARASGLIVNAGHGLNYANVRRIARIPGVHELNIGHSIVARAVCAGIGRAVREMRRLLR